MKEAERCSPISRLMAGTPNTSSGGGELIKSFECLIWAWALLEIGKELKHLE